MSITTLLGSSNDDFTSLIGTAGADTVTSNRNRVYIDLLEDNDLIVATSGIEDVKFDTGEGNDRITLMGEILDPELSLDDGNDIIIFADLSGTIYGGVEKDTLQASSLRTTTNSLVRGDGGEDYFNFANLENTNINLNSDDDILNVAGATTNSQFYGGRQNDSITIEGTVNDSMIRGDAHDDNIVINGNLIDSVVNGNADNDNLRINSSDIISSTIYGGKGNDDITINSDAAYVNGGKDNDTITLISNQKHTIYGGIGNDTIISSGTKALSIDGGGGQDTISLSGARNAGIIHKIDGNSSADSITGTRGEDFIDGGTEDAGSDTLISQGGDDTIYGRAGDDLINLEAGKHQGDVIVQAGAGNDIIEVTLDELTYEDIIKGEKGNDTIAVVGRPEDFDMWIPNTAAERSFNSISSMETLAFGTESSSYDISGEKTIRLGKNVQSAGISTIDASKTSGGGKDVLVVNASLFSASTELVFMGSDDPQVSVDFIGGAGNDTLTTGSPTTGQLADTLTGGLGADTFNIIGTSISTVITDLGIGGEDVLIIPSTASGVTATVKEDYVANSLTINNNTNLDRIVLNADDGIDINMAAASGTEGYVINGGNAASVLQGSNFNDSITGSARVDTLVGNRGNDTFVGGGGDIFRVNKGNAVINDAGNGEDIIIHDEGSSVIINNTGTDTVTVTSSRPNAIVVADNGGMRSVDASTSTSGVWMMGLQGTNRITYTGGKGNDTIQGGNIGDLLTGNRGNDTFTGGLGSDTIAVGNGTNTVIFTSGLSIDQISDYTSDDIGSFDLSDTTGLETLSAVANGQELDFVTGEGGVNPVIPGDAIVMQEITGASTTLSAATNVLKYSTQPVSNAGELETELEGGGTGIITSYSALEIYDAFPIQYQDSDTNTYSYAVAYLEAGVDGSSTINNWKVVDIATTDLSEAFGSNQFSFTDTTPPT